MIDKIITILSKDEYTEKLWEKLIFFKFYNFTSNKWILFYQ